MRYFLHTINSAGTVLDEEGSDCIDLEEARAEARASLRELVADDLRAGICVGERKIEIRDERDATVDRISLSVTMKGWSTRS